MTNRLPARPHAIVIGLNGMTGLQTARILARRGVPVIAIAKDPAHHISRTRVCENILYADTDSEELIDLLKSLGPTLSQKAVLFPCGDINVKLISRNRQSLEEWFHIILPNPETVEMLINKVSFYTYAQNEGFPIPKTFILKQGADIENAAQQINFPCILKPPGRSPEWDEGTGVKVKWISNVNELVQFTDQYLPLVKTLILQEWIEGPDTNLYSCNCYFDSNNSPIVTFVARKLRQWPPQMGVSSLGEECRNDIVLDTTKQLFQSVNYRGLGYLEMKLDNRSGEYFIMEPNVGRPTGRSAIAECGGVELLYTMYCDALGWSLPPNREQKYLGVKWIHLRRDLQSALYYRKRGELSLKEWFQSVHGKKTYAIFDLADLGPFIGDLLRLIRIFLQPKERKSRTLYKLKSGT